MLQRVLLRSGQNASLWNSRANEPHHLKCDCDRKLRHRDDKIIHNSARAAVRQNTFALVAFYVGLATRGNSQPGVLRVIAMRLSHREPGVAFSEPLQFASTATANRAFQAAARPDCKHRAALIHTNLATNACISHLGSSQHYHLCLSHSLTQHALLFHQLYKCKNAYTKSLCIPAFPSPSIRHRYQLRTASSCALATRLGPTAPAAQPLRQLLLIAAAS